VESPWGILPPLIVQRTRARPLESRGADSALHICLRVMASFASFNWRVHTTNELIPHESDDNSGVIFSISDCVEFL